VLTRIIQTTGVFLIAARGQKGDGPNSHLDIAGGSLIPLQFPLAPMRVFSRAIEHPLDVPIERPQHPDPRMH
jgi:hypothetical protein